MERLPDPESYHFRVYEFLKPVHRVIKTIVEHETAWVAPEDYKRGNRVSAGLLAVSSAVHSCKHSHPPPLLCTVNSHCLIACRVKQLHRKWLCALFSPCPSWFDVTSPVVEPVETTSSHTLPQSLVLRKWVPQKHLGVVIMWSNYQVCLLNCDETFHSIFILKCRVNVRSQNVLSFCDLEVNLSRLIILLLWRLYGLHFLH